MVQNPLASASIASPSLAREGEPTAVTASARADGQPAPPPTGGLPSGRLLLGGGDGAGAARAAGVGARPRGSSGAPTSAVGVNQQRDELPLCTKGGDRASVQLDCPSAASYSPASGGEGAAAAWLLSSASGAGRPPQSRLLATGVRPGHVAALSPSSPTAPRSRSPSAPWPLLIPPAAASPARSTRLGGVASTARGVVSVAGSSSYSPWREALDAASGRPYWFNLSSGETTWASPVHNLL